jgi:Flp pilus assembly protein TadD
VLKRRTSSLVLSLALGFAFLAPQAALAGRLLYASGEGVAAATGTPSPEPDGAAAGGADAAGDVDDAEQPKRKGNGFVRALSAPFRALARLFGGGKKSKSETADKAAPARDAGTTAATRSAAVTQGLAPDAQTRNNVASEEAKASVVDAATQTTTNDEAATAAVNDEATAARRAPVEAGVELSRGVASDIRASDAVRIVRPSAGEVAEELRPKMWIPLIAGIPSDPVSQGRALLQHGYLQEAIAELQIAATTVGPELAEANNLLGLAYDRLGWHQQAAAAYGRALNVTPKDANVLSNLGYSLYLADDYDGALKRLKQAARLSPAEPIIYNNLGVVEARLHRYDDAFKYFAKASGEYEAHLKLAGILETEKRDGDAIKHYEVALRMQPGTSAVLERLVALYERTGARDKADTARRTLGRPRNPQKTTTGGG